MGDDHDARAAALTALVDNAFLAHLGDADLAFAEFGGDRGQYTGTVGDSHAHVVTSGDEPDRADRQLAYFDSRGPRPPCTRLRAAITTSPITADAVGAPPAPCP